MASTILDGSGGPYGGGGAPGGSSTGEGGGLLKQTDDPGGGGAAGTPGCSSDQHSQPNPDALRKTLEDVISRESYVEVQRMKRDIEKMSKFERLLLYLELPSSLSGMTDPLRQPLNPLGSRHEIQLTITWIRTHLGEDPQVSLPKHEVYDDYTEFCSHNGLKPLSTADFGKVMKQVFPTVRPRRLGTRGNSRYCYAGLKKRVKLLEPSTPEICAEKTLKEIKSDAEEELNESVSHLVREWAENTMPGTKFGSLQELAAHLIDKMYVDTRSKSAYSVIAAIQKKTIRPPEASGIPNGLTASIEGQDYKRKVEVPPPSDSPLKRGNLKRSKYSPTLASMVQRSPVATKDTLGEVSPASGGYQVYTSQPTPPQRGYPGPTQVKQQSFEHPSQQQGPPGSDGVRTTGDPGMGDHPNTLDDELGNYFPAGSQGVSKPGEPGADADSHKAQKLCQLGLLLQKNLQSPTMSGMASATAASNSVFKPAVIKPEPSSGANSTVGSANDWGPYGQAGASGPASTSGSVVTNSLQPTDVVMSESGSQGVTSGPGANNGSGADGNGVSASANTSLSSRRRVSFNPCQLIQVQEAEGHHQGQAHHGPSQPQAPPPPPPHGPHSQEDVLPAPNVTITSTGGVIQQTNQPQMQQVNANPGPNSHGPQGSVGGSNVTSGPVNGNGGQMGQSPSLAVSTRKRHFSFQPISPRQASLPQSPSASPFISPRSTPVPPMMRSRHSSGSALPLHLLNQPGGVQAGGGAQKLANFNSSSNSDISRAATFGSASECSTPFISPHGTPIPFNRSRHNSAQGRLCRSRHSSGVGVGPYRYANVVQSSGPAGGGAGGGLSALNVTPYSPMALNNLNNPYSPQPATPVSTTCPDDMFVTYVQGGANTNVHDGATVVVQGANGNNVMATQCGGNNVLILNEVVDPRSRHSSAGSTHADLSRSAPMSPHCVTTGVKDVMIDNVNAVTAVHGYTNGGGGGGDLKHRHRHASAGSMNYQPTPDNAQTVTLVQQQQQQPLPNNPMFASAAGAASGGGGDLEFINAAGPSLSVGGGGEGGPGGPATVIAPSAAANSAADGVVRKEGEDDLEMTLSALKDCDTDFSNIFETENGK